MKTAMPLYKWNIDVILRNSNVMRRCVYEGIESNTLDVAEKVFGNKTENYFIDLKSENGKVDTWIRFGDIASFDIYPVKK